VCFDLEIQFRIPQVKDMQSRTPRTLNFGDHGWVEFVAAAPCATQEEVRRFYRRQGGYVALLYALQAVDFHSENVIAAGEYPVLIDLEALFHATPEDIAAAEFDDPASYAMANSVLRIGLLPGRIWGDAQQQGIDISGFGGEAGQLTPFGVPQWEKSATDEMQLTRRRVPLKGSQNRPSLANAELDPRDYVGEITTGFTEIYRFLLENRDQLLSSHGPLACFADDQVRVLLRATRTYAVLLGESFHPDMLRDALDRELLLDRLWVAVEEQPYLAQAIPAERDDMQRADIPIFSAGVTSHDLFTSSNARLANFFPRSGLELVHHQLRLLSEENLSRQLWMIRASLARFTALSTAPPAPFCSARHWQSIVSFGAPRHRSCQLARTGSGGKRPGLGTTSGFGSLWWSAWGGAVSGIFGRRSRRRIVHGIGEVSLRHVRSRGGEEPRIHSVDWWNGGLGRDHLRANASGRVVEGSHSA
jgi:type 2 lantibiotic biosynthesis protein LanM